MTVTQDPLHLLCVEPRFPGRLGAVADWLVRKRGYRCTFYHTAHDPRESWPESVGNGLDLIQYNAGGVARQQAVPWTRLLERGLCYSYGCWEVLHARRPRNIDLILGRSGGLGSTLFVPVFFPGVPIVNQFDYYYHAHANDLAEEVAPDTPPAYFHWRRSSNALPLLDLENGLLPWTPTEWQRQLFPREYRDDFLVLYDGVDSRRFRRAAGQPVGAVRTIGDRSFGPDVRIVSFVARSLDMLRGFDRFLDLANRLLRARGDVVCVALGDFHVQHGLDVTFFQKDYRAHLLERQPPHDATRIWFPGVVPPGVVAQLLAVSNLHVYPSRPYPVSRSLVEAMSAGCTILGADTEPVREFITHARTGLLVPLADADAWERQALAALADPAGHRPLGEAAAELVREKYAQDVTLPALAGRFAGLVEPRRLTWNGS